MKQLDLGEHISRTYVSLRRAVVIIAVTLPLLLWILGHLIAGLPLQQTMSAYYHAGDGAVRDVYVGLTVAVAAILYVYKGVTRFEDWALNLAAFCALGAALFPMSWQCEPNCPKITPHGVFSLFFFASIAYVCIRRASDTLTLIPDEKKRLRYKRGYEFIGVLMIASPAVAAILSIMFQPQGSLHSVGFFAEAASALVFAAYWLLKSHEIAETNADYHAAKGHLVAPEQKLSDAFRPIPMTRRSDVSAISRP
jgi:hypothetical protein